MWLRRKSEELAAVLGRYRLGSAPYDELVAPLADELIALQRKGKPFAATVLGNYADWLYAATAKELDAAPEPVWSALLAPEGRIADDEGFPAVPLMTEHFQVVPFNQYRLGDASIHPHIHLQAALRAIAGARSAGEVAPDGALASLADRAWFVLAFWVNIGLGYGSPEDNDRDVIADLIGCCARLAEFGGEVPGFVRDAVRRELVLHHHVVEWVTTKRYLDAGGKEVSEGHPTVWASGLAIPVGTLLRRRFGGGGGVPTEPDAAVDYARARVAVGDFGAALEALTAAVDTAADPAPVRALLREVVVEESARELATILVQYKVNEGSQERARVREIGADLHRMGGTALMREVHAAFTASQRRHSRHLDMLWDGVGEWLG